MSLLLIVLHSLGALEGREGRQAVDHYHMSLSFGTLRMSIKVLTPRRPISALGGAQWHCEGGGGFLRSGGEGEQKHYIQGLLPHNTYES